MKKKGVRKKGSLKRSRLQMGILVTATVVAVICACALFILYTRPGRKLTSKVVAGYIHGAIQYVETEPVRDRNDEPNGEASGQQGRDDNTFIDDKDSEKTPSQDEPQEKCFHILLLGEEALKTSPGFGRTDSMMLVSILPEQQRMIITSLLRDIYAEPENGKPCKLNAIYAAQGITGLYGLLYDKLGIWPDGYVKVGFDDFEAIVDCLQGAEVTLTQEEADYLNTHNYISRVEYRNVRAGKQVLNGNQVLGYCRVRFVPNCNGTRFDYGRTERQRMVAKSLFERYKAAGITKWVSLLNDILSHLETDINKKKLEELIFEVYDNKVTSLETRQLPFRGTFESKDVIGNVTSTLLVDWDENKRLFFEGFFE